jgi:transposase, IS5 family
MNKRSAIKTDLFAQDHHKQTLDKLGDPLTEIEAYIDFAALATQVDLIAPRPVSPQGGRTPLSHRDDGAHTDFEASVQPV